MKFNWRRALESLKASFSEWSWVHFLIDAGVTVVLGIVFGTIGEMPFWLILLLIVGIAATATGIIEWIRRETGPPLELEITRRNIRNIARSIPRGTHIEAVAVAPLAVLGGNPRNWETESAAAVSAMLTRDLANEYAAIARNGRESAEAARTFLESLADTLSPRDLRAFESRKLRSEV